MKRFFDIFLPGDLLHHMNLDPGWYILKYRICFRDFHCLLDVFCHDMKISGNNLLRLIKWTVLHYPVLIRYNAASLVEGRGAFQLAGG